jgi:LacI family transcriptional regulator
MTAAGLPIARFHDKPKRPDMIDIGFDDKKIGTMAAEWFLRRGFKSFAYCGNRGSIDSDEVGKAFAASVAKAGFKCAVFDEPAIMKKKGYKRTINILQRCLDKWIKTLPPHTAVLCLHDFRASHFLEACLRSGRAVPDDIAIMGQYNDIAFCSCAPVTISSIDVNARAMGEAAMRILESAIDNPVGPKLRRTYFVPPAGIVERESTAIYPVNPPWLAKILLLLDKNMGTPISVRDLAKAAGLSHTSLEKAFRKAFGTTAGKYITSVKMREAKRLLDEKHLNVKEVALRTGFSSPQYFSHAYRDFYGRAPVSDKLAGNSTKS